MKKILIIISISLFSAFCSISANLKFYNINALYGVSMREANAVCKDNNGFIWASSKTGILRFSEDDQRIYQLPYETANVINVRLVYRNNILLAYTNNGQIFRYNDFGDKFELLVNLGPALKNNFLSVNSVLIDNASTIWIAFSRGLCKYKDGQLSIVGKEGSQVRSMTWKNDRQLILSKRNELSIFDIQTLKSEPICQIPASFRVSRLYWDESLDRIWIGTLSNGLYYCDIATKIFSKVKIQSFPEQPVLSIVSGFDSTLLVGIDGQGIWNINKQGDKVLNIYKENVDQPNSLRGNGVYDIYCDQDNKMWVCTFSGGLSYCEPKEPTKPMVEQVVHQTNNKNSLVNNDVNSIIEDSRGNIWFGTNNGISCWDVSGNVWKNFYSDKQEGAQVFQTLCEDNRGRIWAGTYSSGVYVLEGKTGRELAHYSSQVKDSPFVNDFVFDIYKDSQGDIWIGGINSNVICYRNKEDRFQKYTSQPLNTFAELSADQMLYGCTYGLAITDKKSENTKILKNGFLVKDLLVKDGIIWIATSGDGLVKYDPQKDQLEKFTVQSGLPSNFVSSILFSGNDLWIGTENGLCRFDPKNKTILSYSSERSLSGVSFNPNSQCILKNGKLAMGTNNGVLIFDPKITPAVPSIGKIFIQNISVMGRSVRELPSFKQKEPLDSLKKIELKYNQNTITLELLPLGVAAGSKFSWKMEGLDNEWSQPTDYHLLTYANVPSKNLSLKIRLYNNSLSQIIAERTLQITIAPPFWQRWWFIILSLFLILSAAYFILVYYINLIKQHHNEAKIRFFTNTAHDFRTSLTLIKGPIEELAKEKNISESGNYYLNLAVKQARRLSSVATNLMDFQKVDIGKEQLSLTMKDIVEFVRYRIQIFEFFAKNKNIKLSFICDRSNYITAFDESLIEKVVDNLLSNAIKYSSLNGEVTVRLTCKKKKWILEVADNGIGIGKKDQKELFKEFYRAENAVNSKIVGSGIGLLLVKNYVLLHEGKVNFFTQENVGSTFVITIPYKVVAEENQPSATNMVSATEFKETNGFELQPETDFKENNSSEKLSVLVVEDNDDLLNFMQFALKENFRVYTASDGVEASHLISQHLPDLVISDVMMPNMDGFDLCRFIKSNYETSHIPVILLTSLSGKAEQLNAFGLGADDYITKPFDMDLLQLRIKSIIQNREITREKALKLAKGTTGTPILGNEHNDQFLKKVLEVVRNNISNTNFGKDEFASAMNISASLLYKKVKTLTDLAPVDFIKTVRLDHALELLKTGNHTVTEVSELCGFTSIGYFSTVFKKHFGKTPTEVLGKE